MMPYIKTTWIDGVTPISATNMNKIEQTLFDSQTFARVSTIKTVTLPLKYEPTFYIVTSTIPISATTEEIDIILPSGALRVFRNLNYCLIYHAVPLIKPNNRGFDVISNLAQSELELIAGDQVSPYAKLADAYIQGTDLYLKFFNQSTSVVVTDLAIPVEYIARG